MKRFFSLLLCAVMLAAMLPLQIFATESEIETQWIYGVPQTELPENDELFAAYVERAFYPEYEISTWGTLARERLNSKGQKLYDHLKSDIESVANGNSVSTVFNINSRTLSSWGVTLSYSVSGNTESEQNRVFSEFCAQFEVAEVFDALLHDCPLELYWFDKTVGYGLGGSMVIGSTYMEITDLAVSMFVSESYQPSNYNSDSPKVSGTAATKVQTAVSNANDIVAQNDSLSDYAKLKAYRDEICELVSYNYDAAEDEAVYGDPWQIIYVFDGDPSTNVVCEGYSKAFKWLCDKSTFYSTEIACYNVTGTSNGGGHMWSIVTMDDGKNYMADITNSDTGAVGQNGGLFLKGVDSGSLSSGYTFYLSPTMKYVYYDETKSLWGTDSQSILNLSASDYLATVEFSLVPSDNIVYDGQSVTAGGIGSDITVNIISANASDYNVTNEWFLDKNNAMGAELSGGPIDAGTYWVKTTVSHKTNSEDYSTRACKFVLERKTLTVSSASASDKDYDGTAEVKIKDVVLNGVCGSDSVILDFIKWKGELSSADVGVYTSITLSGLELASDTLNYKLQTAGPVTVPLSPAVTINKSTPFCPDVVGEIEISPTNKDKFAYRITPIEGAEYKMDEGAWQDSNLFDLISAGETHNFYARIKETKNNYAGFISTKGEVEFKKWERTAPVILVDVSGDLGNYTLTINPVDDGEYSFDDGLNWSDNNVLSGVGNITVECAVRYKETGVYKRSEKSVKSLDLTKSLQSAPDAFTVTPEYKNGFYTLVIPKVENGLYSFDGINYSENNVKFDCVPGETYTCYVKFAETDTLLESAATSYVVTLPVISIIIGDVNKSGAIDMMDYILLKRNYFGTFKFDGIQLESGDVNRSGAIDMMDYILLKRAYFGTFALA